jgi:hypothetical protein
VNKYLLTLLIIINTAIAWGQDTIVFADPPRIAKFTPVEDSTAVTPDAPVFEERSFTPGYKEKYTDDEFVYERKSTGKSQWERFKEWLAEVLRDLFSFSDSASKGTTIALRILAAIIILAVVYFIVRAILNKEGMWIFGKNRKKIHVEDAIAENIHVMDFNKLVNETKASGNYRLAVRYYYLWLLKKLSLREIIDWHFDKTNSDYLYEITDSRLKKDFEYLSYLYDYSWYGEFPLDETSFAKAEKAFQKTINTL